MHEARSPLATSSHIELLEMDTSAIRLRCGGMRDSLSHQMTCVARKGQTLPVAGMQGGTKGHMERRIDVIQCRTNSAIMRGPG